MSHPGIPNLTAITPVITASRLGGVEPCGIHFRADQTTATLSDGGAAFLAENKRAFSAYQCLEYTWDFGDPPGTETFTHPRTGATLNANTDQAGPEAYYVYRTPGTYTVTLTVRGRKPDGTWITASTTTVHRQGWHSFEVKDRIGSLVVAGGRYTVTLDGVTTGWITADAAADWSDEPIVPPEGELPRYNTPGRTGDGSEGSPWNTVQAALDASHGAGRYKVYCHSTVRRFHVYPVGDKLASSIPAVTVDASQLTGTTGAPQARAIRYEDGGTASGITVTAFSGATRYFDSTYDGSNGAPDGTITRPYNDPATLHTTLWGWLNTINLNRRAYIKRGSDFSQASQGYSRGVIGQVIAYGDGPRPILRRSGSILSLSGSYIDKAEDWVFSGIEFRVPVLEYTPVIGHLDSGTNDDAAGRAWAQSRDVLFDDCLVTGGMPTVQAAVGRGMAFWGCDFPQPNDGTPAHGNQALFTGAFWGHAIVGCTFTGGNGSDTKDHHCYINCEEGALVRWCSFGAAARRNFAYKGSARNRYEFGRGCWGLLIDGCDVTGTNNGIGPGTHTDWDGSNGRDTFYHNVIVQDCSIHDLGGYGVGGTAYNQGWGFYTHTAANPTIRDTDCWNIPYGDILANDWGVPAYYRLRSYRPADATNPTHTKYTNPLGGYVVDNVFMSEEALTSIYGMFDYDLADLAAWTIDRNQYYAPNHSPSPLPFRDRATLTNRSLAEWQAFGKDVNGTYGDPEWPDPASGDFGEGPPIDPPPPDPEPEPVIRIGPRRFRTQSRAA